MRVLHTSDWHLGHTLYDVSREAEHAAFLEWLLDTLVREEVDALLVAGDIFDTANPSADAQAAWYRFVARVRLGLPALDLVVVGGNHDSAARLDAPDPLFSALGVRVIGGLPRRAGALDLDRLLVPLHDAAGRVGAWVAAVPYLRPSDLPPVADPTADRLIDGVRAVYAEALDAARARRGSGQALLTMGHCYMTGSELSELSERKILGGNQHALPVELFPDDLAYVALGHLHKAQSVGTARVRYSGSPIPLSMSEANYAHQVVLAELDDGVLGEVRPIRVPRTTDMLRVPARGGLSLADVLDLLSALPAHDPGAPESMRPWLEVCVSLPRPEPSLRHKVERVLEGRAARLVKLTPSYTGTGQALADDRSGQSLRDRTPEDVFLARHARDYAEPPSAGLLESFHALLAQVQEDPS